MTDDTFESIPTQVLVLASPDEAETVDFSRRLRECGVQTILAADFEEAEQVLRETLELVGAILVPTRFDAQTLKKRLAALASLASPQEPQLVSFGTPPDRRERKRLRKLGIRLALWEPLCESQIRFQINRALNTGQESLRRRNNPRVPTSLDCRVNVGDRQKETTVYSLAETGAFLATPRASMTGAKANLFFRPDGHTLELQAEVVYANVPGNLQRPNLPLGMGVHFAEMDKADKKLLRNYIATRIAQLEV
jgi:hypothetical protein